MASTTQAVSNVPTAGTYALDQSHSHVSFSARHLMVTKVRGRFPVTEGRLVIAEDPTQSSVEAVIDITAVDSGDPKRDEHLRSADLFDADNYPTVSFRSTKVVDKGDGEFTLEGDLTVRDQTRPVTLQGEFLGSLDAFPIVQNSPEGKVERHVMWVRPSSDSGCRRGEEFQAAFAAGRY